MFRRLLEGVFQGKSLLNSDGIVYFSPVKFKMDLNTSTIKCYTWQHHCLDVHPRRHDLSDRNCFPKMVKMLNEREIKKLTSRGLRLFDYSKAPHLRNNFFTPKVKMFLKLMILVSFRLKFLIYFLESPGK